MKLRKQSDETGCGIACIAMLTGCSYGKVRDIAVAQLGFDADGEFYTSTGQLRKLAALVGVNIPVKRRCAFKGWVHLPNKAIVAINQQEQDGTWHWVVFHRENYSAFVLDPKRSLKSGRRADFWRMNPFAFLPVE